MARGLRLNDDGRRAWLACAALLAAGALVAWTLPSAWLDWQPERAADQPWRALSAAFVHWSPLHLVANLGATAVVAAWGVAARVPRRAALAWLLAWPATHLALLAQPALMHYGGLSGVLHSGVAVVCVELLAAPRLASARRARWVAAAVLAGLALKIAFEEPWGPALRRDTGWDIAVAPLAHAAGALAGIAAALLLLATRRR